MIQFLREMVSHSPHDPQTLTGTTNESVTLDISHLLYIEAVGNYVKVCHLRDGLVIRRLRKRLL